MSKPMRYKLNIRNILEYGQRVDSEGNPHQEDCIFPAYEKQKDTDRLFILCDGMGGHAAGEVASSTVCMAMSKSVLENVPDAEGDFDDDNLRKAIADAFYALDSLPEGDGGSEKKMGTTMTFLKFHTKGCTIAHMGDSRVYHIRPGKGRDDTKILFKTSDHSLVNDLIKIGELTVEEAKSSRQKNIITRAMQPRMERRPLADIYHTKDIKKGDYFYMCSDGMLEQMEDENLLFNFSEATGDDDNKVNILIQATSQNLDNHSAIIVHVLDVIDPLPIDEPSTVPLANKPKPIMAEVDEEEQEQCSQDETVSQEMENNEENVVVDKNEVDDEITTTIDMMSPYRDSKRFNHSNDERFAKNNLNERRNLLRFVFLALFGLLLAFIFYFSSKLSSYKRNSSPDKIEAPTPIRPAMSPVQNPGKTSNTANPGQGDSANGEPNKTNVNSGPEKNNKPNKPNRPANANEVSSSVPDKIQNAMSSQSNPSGNINNAEGNVHTQANGGIGQNAHPARVNVNQSNSSDDEVVSSDQQIAVDAANKKEKK